LTVAILNHTEMKGNSWLLHLIKGATLTMPLKTSVATACLVVIQFILLVVDLDFIIFWFKI